MPVFDQKVCAVDRGVKMDAADSVIDIHGTVPVRRFIKRAEEKDRGMNALSADPHFRDSMVLMIADGYGRLRREEMKILRAALFMTFPVRRICDFVLQYHCR